MLPDLVEMCGGMAWDGGPSQWVVTRLGGPVLDLERTLLELDVVDGEMPYLRAAAAAQLAWVSRAGIQLGVYNIASEVGRRLG